MNTSTPTVSVITCCYNSINFIADTIDSIVAQTYKDWELLVVDDCSTDGSDAIIKAYGTKDPRIKYHKTASNSGHPTTPRNIGIRMAQGRYIGFCDSDDLWLPGKLEEQIRLFESTGAAIILSDYERIDEAGTRNGRIVKAPARLDYAQLLCGNSIGCLTALYDSASVGKIYFRDIGHEDYILWLSILKQGGFAVNTQNCQALYRIRRGSVSANKLKVFFWTWHIYYKIEKLGFLKSAYYFTIYAFRGICKSLK